MGCNASKTLKAELYQVKNDVQKKDEEIHRLVGQKAELHHKCEKLSSVVFEKEALLDKFQNERSEGPSESIQLEESQATEIQHLQDKITCLDRQVKEKQAAIVQAKQRMNDWHAVVDNMEQEAKRMEEDYILPAGAQLLVELWEERMVLKGKSNRKPPRFLGEQWFPSLDKIARQREVEVFLSAHSLLCSRPHDQKPSLDSRIETNETFANTRLMFDSEYTEDESADGREGKIIFSARSAMKTVFSEHEHIPDERDLPQNIVLKVWERRCQPNETLASASWNLLYQSHPCPCNIEYDDEYRKSVRMSVADIQMAAEVGVRQKFFEGSSNSSLVILFHEADFFEVNIRLPQSEEDIENLIRHKTDLLSKKHANTLQTMMESQSEQNLHLKESVDQLRHESAQWQERYKSKELLLSKKQEELIDLKNELNKVREEISSKEPPRGLVPRSSPSSDDNSRRFHVMALLESDGLLFKDDRISVHLTQKFPFQNDDLLSLAVNGGSLEARIDLCVTVLDQKSGFETIHLKTTNRDVAGLKVAPLSITYAERNPENEDFPPSVIWQTINFDLVELLESNPMVSAEMVLCPDLYADCDLPGIEHSCEFALPVILTKFFVPLESQESFDSIWQQPIHESRVVVAKTRPTKDTPWLLSLGGAFRVFDHAENGPWNCGGRLLRHGSIDVDHVCVFQAHSLSDMWKVSVKCAESRIAESVATILEAILTCSPPRNDLRGLPGLGC